ncbi:MAG: SufD family Fe-S cluster assembly protein [Candidatus Krumholzibacteria bacterium]|nr:SufD family Fe-S cluster assembly protein [Candidatus Krumholzibacteria bacterium]
MADALRETTLADPRPALKENDLGALCDQLEQVETARQARRDALSRYAEALLPDRVMHLWRFTNPERLLPNDLSVAALSGADVDPTNLPVVDEAAVTVDLWPGRLPVVQLSNGLTDGLLTVGPLDGAMAAGTLDEQGAPSALFRHLNSAAWNAGLQIDVAPGATLPGPVVVRVHARGPAMLPRVLFRVGGNAEATLVEQHLDGGPGNTVIGRSDVVVGTAARVRHVVLQTWMPGTNGHLTVQSRVGRDADLLSVFATFGGERVKVEMMTDLQGEGARSRMVGVALGGKDQRFDHHTRHRHLAGRTWSDIDFKSVGADRSRGSYTGLIRIEEDARMSEAYQVNRNLLLSARSHADAIPELEILNEEVSCSHGATVAPVDQDQLFYLQSRGMSPDEALRLVVRGFLEKTLQSIPKSLRPEVEKLVEDRLAGLGEAS